VFGNPARAASARSSDQIAGASSRSKGRAPYRRKVIAEAATGSISRVNAQVASASQRPISPNSRLPAPAAIPTRVKTSSTVRKRLSQRCLDLASCRPARPERAMVQLLALPVVAFTHEPISQPQRQYRPRQRGHFGRINVGFEDDELAGQCQDRDQNDGLDLDDAF